MHPRAEEASVNPTSSAMRAAFVATVLLGGAIFWVARRPPLGDLPQHAGQIALFRDLLSEAPRWGGLVHINYLTPYLLPLSITAALSALMPVLTAMKLVLTLSFFAFVAAGLALRREFDCDPRLDWLLIPGFFGFAYQYGFYTFLVAAPFGLVFLLLCRRFVERPSTRSGIGLGVAGMLLFFSHGLVFMFGVGSGSAMVVLGSERRNLVRRLAPFAALGLVAVLYSVSTRLHDPTLAGGAPIDWEWNHSWGWHRVFAFLIYVTASTPHDPVFLPAVGLMLAAPWVLGAHVQRDRTAFAPMTVVLFAWLICPNEAMHTAYLYQRFALFLLPAYALVFRRADHASPVRGRSVEAGLAVLSLVFCGSVALRSHRFERESATFETVLAAAEPGERALSIVLNPESAVTQHPWAYHTFPLWYQAERQGFVDFNFAALPPEIVRFRPGREPPLRGNVEKFDWHALKASAYRYFFVRHLDPLPSHLFENDECEVGLVREDGPWALYERRSCRAAPSSVSK